MASNDTPSSEATAPRPSVLRNIASYIIVTEFCERLAYYGFAGSLILFLETRLNFSSQQAVNSYALWAGCVYVTPLLGGLLSDAYLGRYRTILYAASLYDIGLLCAMMGVIPNHTSSVLVFLGMYIVVFGAGGIKPNVSTMGADQFDLKHEQDRQEASSFFSYFYWSINLGALISYTLIAYICQYGLSGLGGLSWGFFVGYSIPTLALVVGIFIFVLASNKYKIAKPSGSMLAVIGGVMVEGMRRKFKKGIFATSAEGSKGNGDFTKISNATPASASDSAETAEDKPSIASAYLLRHRLTGVADWLDLASVEFGGSHSFAQVESAKYIARLVPFLFVMIAFWCIYSQTSSSYQLMGCQMNTNIGGSFDIPISSMNVFNQVAILSFIPLFERFLYPTLKKMGIELTMLKKIGIGFFFAILAMVAAGLVEIARYRNSPAACSYTTCSPSALDNISACKNIDNYNPYLYQQWYAGDSGVDQPLNCRQTCGVVSNSTLSLGCISCDDIPQMSTLSILWQAPLFALIGIAEIFASITSLEFFYSQAPDSVRSVSQACNLFTTALGNWLSIPLVLIINSNPRNMWLTSNLDEGHLSYYFFLLASLMALMLMLFTRFARGFQFADSKVLSKLSAATTMTNNEDSLIASLVDDDDECSSDIKI